MAKAKLVKRKRKLRIEGIASIAIYNFTFAFMGNKIWMQHSYNIVLQKEAQQIKQQEQTLKEAVANLQNEVNTLQSLDRVLSMVEGEGISTNQNVMNCVKASKR